MNIDVTLPNYALAEGAEISVEQIEEAVKEAVQEAATRYAAEKNALEGGVLDVTAQEKPQDGGATLITIAATAFVTGLATQLGTEAGQIIGAYAREWLADRKQHLLTEAEDSETEDR
ncbi:MAG: hypothetical protein AB8B71_08875 [Paracoccaceae bacterium]